MLRVILGSLYSVAEARSIEQEAGNEFSFRWFNAEYALPISLEAANLEVHLVQLVKDEGITKTPLWQRYFDLRREYVDSDKPKSKPFGLIFHVPGVAQYIRHDWQPFVLEPGFNHIVRPAASETRGLVTQPLEAFLPALRRRCVGP
jgi:hypothetical protein